MVTTAPATIPKQIKLHWEQILREYESKTCIHVQITKTTDSAGHIISESSAESTIYGIISTVNEDTVHESMGLIKFGDLTARFMCDVGVIVGEQITDSSIRLDHIEHEGILYTVNQRMSTIYDNETAVISKYILRKVAG